MSGFVLPGQSAIPVEFGVGWGGGNWGGIVKVQLSLSKIQSWKTIKETEGEMQAERDGSLSQH